MASRIAATLLLLLSGAFATAAALAQSEPETQADQTRAAHVTYFTGSTVYIDAGSAEGLVAGEQLQVMRDDAVVAVIEIKDVSTHRSSGSILTRTLDPAVGDVVPISVRAPVPTAPAAAAAAAAQDDSSATTKPRRTARRMGLRGRVGVRYIVVRDTSDDSAGYSQPALNLQLAGNRLGGSAWGFSIDARARRTYQTSVDGVDEQDGVTRLYQLAVFRSGIQDHWDFSIGRQYSPALAAVSIFDGASVAYRFKNWSIGGFTGTQPDPLDFDYSTDLREHGVYTLFHGRAGTTGSWQATAGLIGSYQDSEINREFVYLQGRYTDRKLSFYLTSEVDYNRGWKIEEGEDSISPTSTLLSLNYRLSRAVTFNAGYDNRRNVRLYRNLVTPETVFDDTYRQGAWAGASFYFARRFRLGLGARTNRRDEAGNADSFNLTFGVDRLTRANINIQTRTTRYTNERLEGLLASLAVGASIGPRVYFRANAGMRDEETLLLIPTTNNVTWYGLGFDFDIAKHLFALISLDRTEGTLEDVDQLFVNLSYQF